MHQPLTATDAFRTIPIGHDISWTYSATWLAELIPDGFHAWKLFWEGMEPKKP